ncbi:site-specific integrase [soil metagenome]
MSTKVLSAKLVDALKAPVEGQMEIYDKTLPGFGVRVSKGGRKAWILMYRVNGRKRRLTLGSYPSLTLGGARAAAGLALQAVQKGDDPAHDKLQKRLTQPATFEELAAEYIERYAKPRKRSWKNDEILLRRHILPEWKYLRVSSLKRSNVIAVIEQAENNGQPHLARQILAVIRKLFNWAIEKSLVDSSPAVGIRLSDKPRDRSRILSLPEMQQLWTALDHLPHPWRPYFKILFLTAQRRSEVAHMRWDQISDGVWAIPPEQNKSGRLHMVPLSPEVAALLDEMPRTSSPFVFPSRPRGNAGTETPISGFSAMVRKLNGLLENPMEWRIHDLRRTATSMMARLGFPPHVLAAVLNHAPQSAMKGVLSVYNRYEYLDEKREALNGWGNYVRANVVLEKVDAQEAAAMV